MLKGIKVIDLTGRLPGPHAGYLLSKMGAEVLKIEDTTHCDPFLSSAFSDMDDSFSHWYKALNSNKQILKFDYKNQSEKVYQHLKSADIILDGLPHKVHKILKLDKLDHPHAQIRMVASLKRQTFMHDLNIVAELGHLKNHVELFKKHDIIAPPFYPVAGVYFAHHISMMALGSLLKSQKEKAAIKTTCSLEDAAKNALSPLTIPSQTSYLHNGRYPCYNIYKIKDGYVALAAVEEKFWKSFCETFSLQLTMQDRFYDQDDKIKKTIAKTLSKFCVQQIHESTQNSEMCLTAFN